MRSNSRPSRGRLGAEGVPAGCRPVRCRVPCYFDNDPTAPWTALTGDTYVAGPANIGAGAPMGVNCTVKQFLDGRCLTRLKTSISDAGGSYEVAGD